MPSYYGYGSGLPKAVKYLLLSNAAVFALQILLPSLIPFGLLALVLSLINQYL